MKNKQIYIFLAVLLIAIALLLYMEELTIDYLTSRINTESWDETDEAVLLSLRTAKTVPKILDRLGTVNRYWTPDPAIIGKIGKKAIPHIISRIETVKNLPNEGYIVIHSLGILSNMTSQYFPSEELHKQYALNEKIVDEQKDNESKWRKYLQRTYQISTEERKRLASEWQKWWNDNKHKHPIEWHIEGLSSNYAGIRTNAMTKLFEMTRNNFGYNPNDPPEKRLKSIELWKEWWQKNKDNY